MDQSVPPGNLKLTLRQVSEIVGGTVEGQPDLFLERLTDLSACDPDGLAFAEHERYLDSLNRLPAALLASDSVPTRGIPTIRVEKPREAFLKLLVRASLQESKAPPGIHPTAIISPSARVHPGASIGAFVTIGESSVVENGAILFDHVSIGPSCKVGENSILKSFVCLVTHTTLGKNCLIHPSAVLGADGFGFFWNGSFHQKIPQLGRIEVGDNVEIGALTAIDRAMVGITKIGSGCKIDNLVQVGHNVSLGENVVLAAAVSIGGSTSIGDRCILGGATDVSDHVTLVNDVRVGGGSGVPTSLKAPGDYFGYPAKPVAEGRRNFVLQGKLSEMNQRILDLERKIEAMQKDQG